MISSIDLRDRRHQLEERRRRIALNARHQIADALARRKRLLPRHQLVEHEPDGKDVAAMIERRRALGLLRRHVAERPDRHADGARRADPPDDAEVENLQAAGAAVDDQVGRLDVAVHQLVLVRVAEAGAQIFDQLQPPRPLQHLLRLDDLIERPPLDVVHHEVGTALVIAVVEDADDVVVAQVGDGVGFVAKQPPQLRAHARVVVERGIVDELVEDA